jgi:Glycosyl hydrolase catalytic core
MLLLKALMPVAVLVASLTAATPKADAVSKDFFGVITQTPLQSQDIPLLREAKPGSIRLLAYWNQIQPQAGPCTSSGTYSPGPAPGSNNCNWDPLDNEIGQAAQAGVRARPFLFGSPDWLKSKRKGTANKPWVPPLYSKTDRKAWTNFIKAAVNRYEKGGAFWDEVGYSNPKPVQVWQIWNEPSSPAYFSPKPSAKKYAQLLKLSNKAVNKANKKAKVAIAGVFGTPRRKGGGIDMPDWFRQLYKIRGFEKTFDLAAMHPYSKNMKGISAQIKLMRKAMKQGGDGRTKLWISEIGWASGGPKGHTLAGTKKSQARRLKQAFKLLKRNARKWKLESANWFSWKDAQVGQSSCASCPFAGLLDLNYGEKPAFRAFKKAS